MSNKLSVLESYVDLKAEEKMLGGLLVAGAEGCAEKLLAELSFLSPTDLFSPEPAIVFGAMQEVGKNGRGININTVEEQLRYSGLLETVGGVPYLIGLLSSSEGSFTLADYAGTVKRYSWIRQIMKAASTGDFHAINKTLREADAPSGFVTAAEQAEDMLAMLDRNIGGQQLIPWGFKKLDDELGGIMAGDLIYLGGRPSMGKTELLAQVTLKNAMNGRHVAVCSMEMNKNSISERLVSIMKGVSIMSIRKGDERVKSLISEAAGEFSALPVTLCYGRQNVDELAKRLEQLHYDNPISLIVVDHFQKALDLANPKFGDNLTQRAGYVSGRLCGLAKDINVPIIVASQLNREATKRFDHRPELADLRESGDLEQDADLVFLLNRPQLSDHEAPNITEVIVAKTRQLDCAPCVELTWDEKRHQFKDGY